MIIIDVREKDEFEAEHIPGSVSCPLSQLELLAPGLLKNIKDEELVLMCRSGKRAKLALDQLQNLDIKNRSFQCYEGGINQWKAQGNEIKEISKRLPLIRQVHIIASILLLSSFFGVLFISKHFAYLVLLVGLGLGLSGFTGFCAMMELLQKMPWNKTKNLKCVSADTKSSCCN